MLSILMDLAKRDGLSGKTDKRKFLHWQASAIERGGMKAFSPCIGPELFLLGWRAVIVIIIINIYFTSIILM